MKVLRLANLLAGFAITLLILQPASAQYYRLSYPYGKPAEDRNKEVQKANTTGILPSQWQIASYLPSLNATKNIFASVFGNDEKEQTNLITELNRRDMSEIENKKKQLQVVNQNPKQQKSGKELDGKRTPTPEKGNDGGRGFLGALLHLFGLG